MPAKFSRARISDIAKKAEVSSGTVDRVLHNRGEVAAKTRDRILKIIEELNYTPDILASTLASKKTYRFASLIPEAIDSSQFWAIPAAGFEKALEQVRHYGVEHDPYVFKYFDRESFKNMATELINSKPDGLILAPIFAELAENLANQCQESRIPLVFINANISGPEKLSFVGQDSFRSGMVAARLLDYRAPADSRYLVINFMSEKSTNLHLRNREDGFRSYFSQHSLDKKILHTLNIIGGDYSNISEILGKELMTKTTEAGVDGIFVTNSRVFLVADYLERNGIKDIRLIGYDLLEANISHLQNNIIDFLISQKPFVQGYLSFMTLFDHLVLKKDIPKHQYLPIDIITRENIDYYMNNLLQ
ncbi:MAG: LacI family DNA-binding transcriptional regulator [Bacteroidales bacterium]|nr:LacI family DNA-binding transcriptional regulator [Bacteroidales bacterium]